MTIFPCTEAAKKKFDQFQSSPRFMGLEGKELVPLKAAEAETARQVAQKNAWVATKMATQARMQNKNDVTWVIYSDLPSTLQDKAVHIKEAIVKHIKDVLNMAFPNCSITWRWSQSAMGGNRLSAQFFLVDPTGAPP